MSESDFLKTALAERQRLFVMLRDQSADFRKYIAVRKLVSAYGVIPEDDAEASITAPISTPARVSTGTTRAGSKAAIVQAAAERWFKKVQRRAQSLEIMRALEAENITFAGPKPTAALASILSNSDLFDNVRGEGYGLRLWGQNAEPNRSAPNIDTQTENGPQGEEAATQNSESAAAE